MAELPSNITVNLSDEDRALLTKIADLLTRNDDPAVPESIRRLTEREVEVPPFTGDDENSYIWHV